MNPLVKIIIDKIDEKRLITKLKGENSSYYEQTINTELEKHRRYIISLNDHLDGIDLRRRIESYAKELYSFGMQGTWRFDTIWEKKYVTAIDVSKIIISSFKELKKL